MNRHFTKVVVCGAGIMGHSLALLHALKSEVWLMDISEQSLARAVPLMRSAAETLASAGTLSESPDAVMARIHCSQDLASCLPGADLVVEAISENPNIKRSFFASLTEGPCSILGNPHTLVASNTSSLDIFSLAPEALLPRLYGAHHFVPPHIIPLAEIAQSPQSSPDATERLMDHYRACGAVPVLLDRFCPGFVVNRIQKAIHGEMFKILEEGIVDAKGLDLAVIASLGIRIPVLGVLKRLDFAGLELVCGNMTRLGLTPPKAVTDLVDRGDFGVKTGKGFYDYSDRSPESVYEERDMALLRVRSAMESAGLLSSSHSKE